MIEIRTLEPTTAAQHDDLPPILFVHGSWHGAWCWEPYFMPYFVARGYTTHALSFRGHGESTGNVNTARLHHYVADLAWAALQLPAPPIIVAHSLGALVTLKYIECGGDVVAAVFQAPVPTVGTIPCALRIGWRAPRLGLHLLRTRAVPDLTPLGFFSARVSEAQSRAYFGTMMGDESILAVGLDAGLLNRPRPVPNGPPILVQGALRDILFEPGEIAVTAQKLGAELRFYDTGHDLMLDNGWAGVADDAAAWLETVLTRELGTIAKGQ